MTLVSTGNLSFFSGIGKLVPEKSLRTGIGKIWYRKKESEPVSEKFGTRKSLGTSEDEDDIEL